MNDQKPPVTDRVAAGAKRPPFLVRFFLPRYMVRDDKKLGDDFWKKVFEQIEKEGTDD